MHILDIAENSIDAHAKRIEIRLEEDRQKDLLMLEIIDDGKGMDEEMVRRAQDPFMTTRKTRRVGLGLPLLAEAAKAANGGLSIESEVDRGTRVRATFQLSHIDTKPLGDIAQTIITLIMGHPEIDIHYQHQVDRSLYSLDTKKIKSLFYGIPITSPEVINFISTNLKKGIETIRRQK